MIDYGTKPRVHLPTLTTTNLAHGGLHLVVRPVRNTVLGDERVMVRAEQYLNSCTRYAQKRTCECS